MRYTLTVDGRLCDSRYFDLCRYPCYGRPGGETWLEFEANSDDEAIVICNAKMAGREIVSEIKNKFASAFPPAPKAMEVLDFS